ncbi:hypothetical protein ASG87_13600 [Frateuria sp. Soil773]|uniref:hypothetical protein n=1 Tax=Frateuria sp. Soil773 TaxID=1736407 RepID=UPI0006F80AAA|nr:hypothetical protein [Frateuria sp. Soil773]KRF00362.1 hypothetical protein ASG87_13600 [Frateuria sp. Soil773]
MKPSVIATALLGATLVLAGCGKPPAGDAAQDATAGATPAAASTAPAPADWSSLETLVGRYPADVDLYGRGPLVAPLQRLLGERFARFKANMQVSGPLSRAGDLLYVTGNKPHEGGEEAGYLLVDPAARQIEVGLWEGGKLGVYRSGADLADPPDVQAMIRNATP